ncbi:MAG: DUF1002 domain-containing protein, partial [Staphylococcus warneri]|nr:DUF1002 domain-containing protein [Staphylococcus warneri]
DETNSKDQENNIKEEIFIKGANLNDDQTKETEKKLDVNNNTKTIEINAQEVSDFTNHNYATIYSSASIKPKKFKSGVDVDIVTKDKITDVSKAQYMNAAVSAGIQNADIKIASVNTVTGKGALTGIYKAYKDEGNKLSDKDIDNASQEINDLSSISQNHKNNDNYSDGAMNNAVANMKGKVAKEKQNNNDISDDKTKQIVDDTLEKKKLDNVLTDDEKAKIQNILNNTKNSEIVNNNPKTFIKQTKHITNNVSDTISDKANQLNNNDTRNWFQRTWDKIKSFF